jgi:hypothetical protein
MPWSFPQLPKCTCHGRTVPLIPDASRNATWTVVPPVVLRAVAFAPAPAKPGLAVAAALQSVGSGGGIVAHAVRSTNAATIAVCLRMFMAGLPLRGDHACNKRSSDCCCGSRATRAVFGSGGIPTTSPSQFYLFRAVGMATRQCEQRGSRRDRDDDRVLLFFEYVAAQRRPGCDSPGDAGDADHTHGPSDRGRVIGRTE